MNKHRIMGIVLGLAAVSAFCSCTPQELKQILAQLGLPVSNSNVNGNANNNANGNTNGNVNSANNNSVNGNSNGNP